MSQLIGRCLSELPYLSLSKHQLSKPRAANQSIADESGRPGTCKSNVGCDAIDEPWTNTIVPLASRDSTLLFRHRNSRTSPLRVQCSVPCTFTSLILTSLTKTFAPHLDLRQLTNFPRLTRPGKDGCRASTTVFDIPRPLTL